MLMWGYRPDVYGTPCSRKRRSSMSWRKKGKKSFFSSGKKTSTNHGAGVFFFYKSDANLFRSFVSSFFHFWAKAKKKYKWCYNYHRRFSMRKRTFNQRRAEKRLIHISTFFSFYRRRKKKKKSTNLYISRSDELFLGLIFDFDQSRKSVNAVAASNEIPVKDESGLFSSSKQTSSIGHWRRSSFHSVSKLKIDSSLKYVVNDRDSARLGAEISPFFRAETLTYKVVKTNMSNSISMKISDFYNSLFCKILALK